MHTFIVCSSIAIATLLAVPDADAEESCGRKLAALTCTHKKCPVVVFKDNDQKWQVFPYKLKVEKQDAKILFVLLDGSTFITDPTKKHGVKPKVNGGGQFSDGFATDEFGENPTSKPMGPHWHVKFKNDGAGKDEIEYTLTFQDANGKTIECDPMINDSGVD